MSHQARWRMTISDDERRFYEMVGARIASLRIEHGLTQAQLGAAIGVSQQTINSFETAFRRVPTSALPKLSTTLHVPLEEILYEKKETRRGPAPKLTLQFDRVRSLPRTEQARIIEMLDDALNRAERRATT